MFNVFFDVLRFGEKSDSVDFGAVHKLRYNIDHAFGKSRFVFIRDELILDEVRNFVGQGNNEHAASERDFNVGAAQSTLQSLALILYVTHETLVANGLLAASLKHGQSQRVLFKVIIKADRTFLYQFVVYSVREH